MRLNFAKTLGMTTEQHFTTTHLKMISKIVWLRKSYVDILSKQYIFQWASSNKWVMPDVFGSLHRVMQGDGFESSWSLDSNPETRRLDECLLYVSPFTLVSLSISLINLCPTYINGVRRDGVHLSEEGSKVVVEEILEVLKEAEWEPSLHWKSMATEFSEDSPYDLVASDGKTTINPSEWTYHRKIQWD